MAARVLLVEDSSLVTDAYTILFESRGLEVRVAASVAEAVAAGMAWPADVLLLDLTLPDGDGLTALAALREAGRAPPIAVALTGHDDDATITRCRAAGCLAVLRKPVPVPELLARVCAWAEEARALRSDSGSLPG